MAEVRLNNVTRVYENTIVAVENLNLTIDDKDFVVLVGPSGCGKSTTLRLIAGLEEVTNGEIYIGDRLVNDVPPKDRDVAMVFQNYALYPHMTVYQNLSFGLKMRKVPQSEINNKVARVGKILGIEDIFDRKPKSLSGGQRQRVALGRAIVRDPKVFLFDEPLSNLDAKLRVQMRAEIIKLHNHLQTTTIYVTHDQIEAMTMGHRIVALKDGRVQQVDTPMNLYNFPQNIFVAGFIGSPSMNFFEGTITRNDGLLFVNKDITVTIPNSYETILGKYEDRVVVFGIRPEDIQPHPVTVTAANERAIRTIVDMVELMGNEIYIYSSITHDQIIVRSSSAWQPALNETIELNFNSEKFHFFDKATEKRIT